MSERPVSAFSRAFAAHLRGVMAERNVNQQTVADLLGRSKGYVSEHTSGKRAVDSDLLDAVAEVAGIESRDLFAEIARRMAADPQPRAGLAESYEAGRKSAAGPKDHLPAKRRSKGA